MEIQKNPSLEFERSDPALTGLRRTTRAGSLLGGWASRSVCFGESINGPSGLTISRGNKKE